MLKTRTRLVNFRVTDEEFAQLRSASDRQGARCLSDFARSVILGQANHPAVSPGEDERLVALEMRLSALERSMPLLIEFMAGLKAKMVGAGR